MNIGLAIACLALSAALDVAAQMGSIDGVVTFRGEIPKSAVPDDAGVHRDLIEMDRNTRGIRFVVVHLSPTNAALSNSLSAVAQSSQRKPQAKMDQQDYAFVPRVLAVREGEPVIFTNSDPANHNVRTVSSIRTNEFNVYVGPAGKYEHRFEAQKTPVRLGCDIHPWMQGWIYVFQHPHFTVTDAKGRFHMDYLPPGEYKLVFHQPDIRYKSEQTITVSTERSTRIELQIHDDNLPRPKE